MPRPVRRNRKLTFEILEDRITPTISPTLSTVIFASPTDTSGTTDTATITVEDTTGAAVTGLTTTDFNFSLSGGASTGTFGSVTETGTPGTYTANFTGDVANGAATLTLAIDGVTLTSLQPTVTVTAGPADPVNSTITLASPVDVLNAADTATIVVADAAGNPITTLGNSDFSFGFAGGTSTGSFGTVTEIGTSGTYTADFTGSSVGSATTCILAIDSVTLNSQPQVTVTPGAVDAATSTVTFASSTDASGTTDQATIVVADANGDELSGLISSAFNFSLAGGTSTGSFGTVTETGTPGTYTANFTGILAGSADTLTLTIGGVTLTSTQPTVTVTPGAVDAATSTVTLANSTNVSGTTDQATIVVVDAAGNPITDLTNTDFALTLSTGASTGSFGTVTETTPGTYTANFTGDIANGAAILTVAIDSVPLASTPTVTVTPGAVDAATSTVSFASPTDASGTTDAVTIVVADAAGNPITDLTNTDFALTLSTGASTGSFGAVTETTPGTYTANFTGDIANGAAILTVAIDSVPLASTPTVTVTPGAVDAATSTVTLANSTNVSGTTDQATIVVVDAAGNPITDLTNTDFALTLSTGASTGSFGTVTEITPGTYTANFTGDIANGAAILTVAIDSVPLASTPTVTVTPGAVDTATSTVSFASPTDASGTTDAVTIVVVDAAGNPITDLTNTDFALTLSTGASTGSFGAVTETTPGTYTANFTGDIANGAATLTVAIDSLALTSTPTVTVTPGAVDAATSTITLASSTDASGTTDQATIVVVDAAGNPITDTGAFDFSFSGGTSTGSFGAVTEIGTSGTYTANFTGDLAGSAATVTLAIGGVTLTSTSPTVTVTPGAVDAATSTVTLASSTDASGTTDQATIVVVDVAGNPITGLGTGAFVFNLSGGSTGSFGTVTETIPGTYTANFTGDLAGSAATVTLAIGGVTLTSTSPTVTVTPGAVDAATSTITLTSSTDVSGTTDQATIVVVDAAGNPITSLGTGAFVFSLAGGSTGSFGTVTEIIPGTYTANFTGDLAGSAATVTLAIGGVTLTSTSPTVTVTPSAVDAATSTVSFASPTDVSGTTDAVTIVVVDAAGNPITDLTNTDFALTLSTGASTGSFGTVTEIIPGTYTANFTGDVANGAAILTVAIDSVPLASTPTVTVTPGAVDAATSTVSFASPTDASGTTDAVTIVVADAAGNPITTLGNSDFALTLSTGASTGSFGTVTETTPGTYTANFTGDVANGAATLTVAIDSVPLASTPTVTVTPGAVDAATSTVSFASPTDASGTTDAVTIVVVDAAGNPITTLGNSDFALTLSTGASTGSFGTVTEIGTSGTYTANFTGDVANGATTLTVAIDSVALASTPTVTVTPGAVDAATSTITLASSTNASGTTDAVTIVVADAAGNPITGLGTGVFDFSLSAGSTGSFGTVTETATPGTYTTDFTGILAGSAATVTLTIGGVTLTSTQPTIQVTPGAVSVVNSTVTFASSTDVLNTTDTVTIVVEDAAGNPIATLEDGDFAFTLSGGTSNGSFGAVTETATPGTYTADFTGSSVGSAATFTLAIDSVPLNSQPQVTVTPGPVDAATSTVTFANPTDASGTTDQVTIVVADANGDAISGLISSEFNFSLSAGSTGSFGTVTETATPGTYTTDFTGILAGSAATVTLTIGGVTLTSTQPTIQVTPGAVNAGTSTISFASPTVVSGTTDIATIVVEDAAGNAITGLATGAFNFSLLGTSTGSFGAVTETATPGTYTTDFTGELAGSADTLTLQVDSVQLTDTPTIQVTPGAVDAGNSTVTFASPTNASGTTDTATIVVEDTLGNAITGLTNSAFVFSLSGGTSTGSFGTVTETATPGTYTVSFTGILAGSADTLTLQVSGVQLTSQPQVTVTPGAVGAGQTTVSFAAPTLTSGKTDILTIVVRDTAGNVVSDLTNSDFTFDLSGGGSNGGFGTVTQTATPGTYTAVFNGITTGSASSLETIINAIPINATPTVQVQPGPLSGSTSSVGFATPTAASGTTDAVTIVLEDAEGNAITGLPSKDFVFTLSGGTSTGKVGTVSETATPGTYTANFTGTVAGTAKTLSLKVNGISIATHATIQVTPGAVSAAKTTVSFASSSVASGKSDLITIVVKDAAGNAIKGLTTSDFALSLSGGSSIGSFGTVTAAATPGVYKVAFTGVTAGTASTLTVAINSTPITAHPKVTVQHGPLSASTSSATFAVATVASGTTDTLTLVVSDAIGNPIGGLTRTAFAFTFSGGKSTGTFGPLVATATPGTYTIAFTGVTAGTTSTLTVKINGVQLATQPTVQVTPGAVNRTKSTITLAHLSVASGNTDTVTIAVKDAAGNAITGLLSSAFNFSLLGGASTGSFGTVTETATPGTYTVLFTGANAGSASTVLLVIDNILLNEQPKVQVTA